MVTEVLTNLQKLDDSAIREMSCEMTKHFYKTALTGTGQPFGPANGVTAFLMKPVSVAQSDSWRTEAQGAQEDSKE